MSLARAALLALACLALSPAASSDEAAGEPGRDGALFEPPAPGSYELPAIDRVSEHRLLRPDGSAAELPGIAQGEVAVVSFIYRSCSEAQGCPLALATLRRLDRELAKQPERLAHVRLFTVSFDPARDAPGRMGELRAALEPRGRWDFLTAPSPQEIAPVLADYGQDAAGSQAGDPANGRLGHVLKVFLLDSQRDVRNIYSSGYLDWRLILNDALTLLGSR